MNYMDPKATFALWAASCYTKFQPSDSLPVKYPPALYGHFIHYAGSTNSESYMTSPEKKTNLPEERLLYNSLIKDKHFKGFLAKITKKKNT